LSGEYSTVVPDWQTKLIETRQCRCHKNDKAAARLISGGEDPGEQAQRLLT
jgi:hypothetical protein